MGAFLEKAKNSGYFMKIEVIEDYNTEISRLHREYSSKTQDSNIEVAIVDSTCSTSGGGGESKSNDNRRSDSFGGGAELIDGAAHESLADPNTCNKLTESTKTERLMYDADIHYPILVILSR